MFISFGNSSRWKQAGAGGRAFIMPPPGLSIIPTVHKSPLIWAQEPNYHPHAYAGTRVSLPLSLKDDSEFIRWPSGPRNGPRTSGAGCSGLAGLRGRLPAATGPA